MQKILRENIGWIRKSKSQEKVIRKRHKAMWSEIWGGGGGTVP